jgi:hypothetical protein
MSSAFRRLAHLDPTAATAVASTASDSDSDSGDQGASYLSGYVNDFMTLCRPSSSSQSAAPDGDSTSSQPDASMEEQRQRDAAHSAWVEWFKMYAGRVVQSEEVSAWETSAAAAEMADQQTWQDKRKGSMLSANPRFVLRQWVLEELIKDMEDALSSGDERGRRDARKRLNAVMEVSDISPSQGGFAFRRNRCIRNRRGHSLIIRWPRTRSNPTAKTCPQTRTPVHRPKLLNRGVCVDWAQRTCWDSSARVRARPHLVDLTIRRS